MKLTILVPSDGSPLASRALPFATSLVPDRSGRVVLVHVRSQRNEGAAANYDPAPDVASLSKAGVTASSLVYRAPPERVSDILHDAARESAADLVVMSTHGRSGLRRSVLGSVADQMIRRAEVPVLLIPPDCEASWETQRPAQILVPLDGSQLAEAALAPAARMAEHLDAEVLLVRALSPVLHASYLNGKPGLSCADFDEVEDAWKYLTRLADGLRKDGRRASVRVLVGSPAAAIADAAREEKIDLIAMTTHGRGGLGRIMLGSIADGVLHQSKMPILLVRPESARRTTIEASVSADLESAGVGVAAEASTI